MKKWTKLALISGLIAVTGICIRLLLHNQVITKISDQIAPDLTTDSSQLIDTSSSLNSSNAMEKELPEVFAKKRTNSPGKPDPFLHLISRIHSGTSKDITEMLTLYETLEDGPEKYAAFFSLMKHWGKFDPDAAMQYAQSVKVKDRDRDKLIQDIYGDLARQNPTEFISSVLNIQDLDIRTNRSVAAVQLLSGTNPDLLVPVIESETQSERRNQLLKTWLKVASKSHHGSILNYVSEFHDKSLRQQAAVGAMEEVSKVDPELAGFHYSRLLTDTEVRISALPAIIKGYVKYADGDLAPVTQWMHNQIPTGIEKDVAAATIVDLLASEDINDALTWLSTIEDEDLYNSTVQEIEKKYSKNKISDPRP